MLLTTLRQDDPHRRCTVLQEGAVAGPPTTEGSAPRPGESPLAPYREQHDSEELCFGYDHIKPGIKY